MTYNSMCEPTPKGWSWLTNAVVLWNWGGLRRSHCGRNHSGQTRVAVPMVGIISSIGSSGGDRGRRRQLVRWHQSLSLTKDWFQKLLQDWVQHPLFLPNHSPLQTLLVNEMVVSLPLMRWYDLSYVMLEPWKSFSQTNGNHSTLNMVLNTQILASILKHTKYTKQAVIYLLPFQCF